MSERQRLDFRIRVLHVAGDDHFKIELAAPARTGDVERSIHPANHSWPTRESVAARTARTIRALGGTARIGFRLTIVRRLS